MSTQGNRNIIVEIPGKNASNLVDAVKRTAQLRFRLVAGQPQPGTPAASQSATRAPRPTPSSPSAKPSSSPPRAQATARRTSSGQGHTQAASRARSPTPRRPRRRPPPPAQAPSRPRPTSTPPRSPRRAHRSTTRWPGRRTPGSSGCRSSRRSSAPRAARPRHPGRRPPDQPLIACDDDGLKFLLSKPLIEGTELKSASYGIPQNGVGWAVNLGFKSTARKVFGDTTTALNQNGGTFAIVLDGQVISYAGVNEPILDGNAQITGDFTEAEARSLSNSLKYGALPIKFAKPTVETIGPSLAGNQLSAGILAGVDRPGDRDALLPALLPRPRPGRDRVAGRGGVITYGTVLVLSRSRPASR